MHYNTWHGSIIGHPQPQSPYIVIISLTYVIQHYLKCVSSVSLFLLHKKNLNRIIMSRVLKWKDEFKSALNWAFTLIDILMAARKCSIILLSILRIMMQMIVMHILKSESIWFHYQSIGSHYLPFTCYWL